MWLASFSGDKTEADVRRYSFMGETQEEARLGPLPTDLIWRTVIAGAVDDTGYLYLASGLIPLGETVRDAGIVPRRPGLLRRAALPADAGARARVQAALGYDQLGRAGL